MSSPDDQDSDSTRNNNRRNFLTFAGSTLLASMVPRWFEKNAQAGTWVKIPSATGSPLTWRKLTVGATSSQIGVARISAGTSHSVILRSDGAVLTTGYNGDGYNYLGQLGTAVEGTRSTYAQATGLSTACAVVAGLYHTLALRADGRIFGCGDSFYGAIGTGLVSAFNTTFVQATGISNAIAMAAGWYMSVALRSDGLVFAAGQNMYGQLGNNSTVNKLTFVQALGISNAVAVSTSDKHAVALRADGLVFSTGENLAGAFGNNSVVSKSTYVQATGISNAIAIAAGAGFTLALRSDGMVFGSGGNGNGQIGQNSTVDRSTFVQAVGISNAVAVAAGVSHGLALRADGLIFATGYNIYGTLGDNSTIARSSFVQASGISNAIAIAAGNHYSLALRSDGALFACGLNDYCMYGDGTALFRSTFVKVTTP
jgi:alpha-tubulin suppressor-like RCC1 family protein